MTRRQRTYLKTAPQKNNKRPRDWGRNVGFVVLVAIFCLLSVVFLGNKFLTTTETCTVENTNIEDIASNGGGIPRQEPVLYVYSQECPPISYDRAPEGYASLNEVSKALKLGNAYEFEVGFFRAELLGFKDSSWRGVNINTPH